MTRKSPPIGDMRKALEELAKAANLQDAYCKKVGAKLFTDVQIGPGISMGALRSARAELRRTKHKDGDNVVIPKEPTEAMLVAARDWSSAKYGRPIGNDAAIGCYHAMLAARPECDRL